MAQSFVKCEICDERECALICLDCDQYFCQKCKEGHIKTKTTKHHQFLDSGTFQPQYKKMRCAQHEHHFIFFCERCETLVCPVCLPENHQEHRMLKIDKVASIKKKELNETLKIFVTKLNEFDSEVNSIQSITEKCKGENKDVIQHVDEQAKHISNVLENQRRCIIKSVKQKAKTEEKRISILLEDLQHCMKEAKELERKVKLDLQGSETSLLSNFQLRKSKLDTFEFNDTTISTCPVKFSKYNVPKEELSLLESIFSGNLCGLSEHEERNTLKSFMSKHDGIIEELQKELTNQNQIRDQQFRQQLNEKDKRISDLNQMINRLKEKVSDQEKKIKTIKKERDDLQLRSQSIQKVIDDYEKCIEKYQRIQAEKEIEFQSKQQGFLHQLKQNDHSIFEKNRIVNQQKSMISNLEETIRGVRKEKDDLQTRLSSVEGEQFTKGNPFITDLGDPFRPMKIGEKYGELYDNEWVDALENTMEAKIYYPDMKQSEIEEIIIRHLHRLLKCCYIECIQRAEEQIHKLGEALRETMCLTLKTKDEIASIPVIREALVLRRAKSNDFAKFLFENKVFDQSTK